MCVCFKQLLREFFNGFQIPIDGVMCHLHEVKRAFQRGLQKMELLDKLIDSIAQPEFDHLISGCSLKYS